MEIAPPNFEYELQYKSTFSEKILREDMEKIQTLLTASSKLRLVISNLLPTVTKVAIKRKKKSS